MSNFNVNYFYKFELFLLTFHYSQPPTPELYLKHSLKWKLKYKIAEHKSSFARKMVLRFGYNAPMQ